MANVDPVLVAETSQCRRHGERRSRRGEVARRGSLAAAVTSNVSRAEFFVDIEQGNVRPSLTRRGGLFVPPESAAGNLPIAIFRGWVNTVKDARPLVTRDLIVLDRWRVLPRVRVTRYLR